MAMRPVAGAAPQPAGGPTPLLLSGIAATRAGLAAAQAALETYLEAQGAPKPLRLRALLLFEEAFMNTLLHAFDDPAGQCVQLRATLAADALVLQLEDQGRPFDAPIVGVPRDPALGALGGRGLLLMQRLAQQVERQRVDGKNQLTLRLARG
jgi:anti-sigma regulatory factor (Ser/Thr protein kinase)